MLRIPSHTILDTTPQFIPTGKRVKVDCTPFDFTSLITQNTNIYIKWKGVPQLTFMVDDQVYGYQNFEAA